MFIVVPMFENDSIQVVHQVLCLKMELEAASETPRFFKKLDDGLCQLISLMLYSLF